MLICYAEDNFIRNILANIDISQKICYNPVMKKQFYHLNHLFTPSRPFDSILLKQLGRMICTQDSVVEEHVHLNWYELTIAKNGKGILYTNGVNIPIKQGDIYLSFPADIHAIYPDKNEPLAFDFIAIYPQNQEDIEIFETIQSVFHNPKTRLFSDETIASLVGNVISEFDQDSNPVSTTVVSYLLHLILLYLQRNFTKTQARAPVTPKQNELFCYSLMNYIDTHIFTINNLSSLSETFNYEYIYLSKLFKRTTGQTLWDYYQNSRLQRAQLLIKNKVMKVGEIAEMLNYSSIYAFSKAYKNYFGHSPTFSFEP